MTPSLRDAVAVALHVTNNCQTPWPCGEAYAHYEDADAALKVVLGYLANGTRKPCVICDRVETRAGVCASCRFVLDGADDA